MTIKFTNPTNKHICFLLGNEEGTLESVAVFIEPNNYSVYEMNEGVFTRFKKEFEQGMTEYGTRYDRL